MLKIYSKRVYLEERFQEAVLSFENGKIAGIEKGHGAADFDFADKMILPGLIDIHCHGYKSFSFNMPEKEGLLRWLRELPLEGCTAIMASPSSAPDEEILAAFDLANQIMNEHPRGAEILGIHSEGPLISFAKAGAQDKYNIVAPTPQVIERWQKRAQGRLKLCCIAPEMDRDHAAIKYCAKNGIHVALGHTNAGYDEAVKAVQDGATDFTHTFNAMTQLEHRAPGVVGAAMTCDSAYTELIADGVHVHPAACLALARCKGKDKLIIITDSVKAKGLPVGEYTEDGTTIYVREDGSIRLKDGTLAGSGNKMNVMLHRAINLFGIDPVTAVNAATKNPCEMLGIKHKGLFEKGRDADAVVFDDEFNVIQTFVMGEAYNKQ